MERHSAICGVLFFGGIVGVASVQKAQRPVAALVLKGDFFVQALHGIDGAAVLGERLELAVELVEVFVAKVLKTDVRVTRTLGGADQLVQLDLHGLAVAVLGVLNKEHHQEGDDGSAGINHQLPGVRVVERRAGERPNTDNKDGTKEHRSAAGPDRDAGCDRTKNILHDAYKYRPKPAVML